MQPLALGLLATAVAACGSPEDTPRAGRLDATASWTGLTVAEVVAHCGTPDSDLSMRDEPPGKLRGVGFDCHGSAPPRRVELEFDYHSGLFSADRSWALELVKSQRVTRVLEAPLAEQ